MEKLFNKVFGQLESGQTNRIDKKLERGKEIDVGLMNSKRYFGKGSNGLFIDDDAVSGSLDEYEGEVSASIPSTAIKQVNYDPKTGVCNVLYVGGNKWYRFENMSPQQFKSFMDASSKGRYVNNVMRVKNRAKGY
ncbi:MAG: KTSC domain-containing protein [Treponema sp.]|nr:KTSC domain-containing protein [Treponema sp.]